MVDIVFRNYNRQNEITESYGDLFQPYLKYT